MEFHELNDDAFDLFFRHGKIYLKIAKKFLEKGSGYAAKETDRLQRMLEKV